MTSREDGSLSHTTKVKMLVSLLGNTIWIVICFPRSYSKFKTDLFSSYNEEYYLLEWMWTVNSKYSY